MVKTILCYGDSNTWGFNPANQERFAYEERWPGVLANTLGRDYRVIEEGMNGRTTVFDDPLVEGRNGKQYLVPCLDSHRPIDLVVLMLGTNDLKGRFSAAPGEIARGVELLVGLIEKSGAGPGGGSPQILLMAPPVLGKLSGYAYEFEGAQSKSTRFGELYRAVADVHRCHFLDAGTIIVSSDLDGLHFEPSQHAKLGRSVAECVKQIFGKA